MFEYTGRVRTVLALVAVVALGACKSDASKQDTTLAADSTLNRDLSLANRDSAAQPQLKDVPANPPATSTPSSSSKSSSGSRSTPSRTGTSGKSTTSSTTASGNTVTRGTTGGGTVGTIASGTELSLASTARVCTNTNKVGDKITATLASPVSGSNGVAIPAGATVTLTATTLKRSENANDKVVMEFAVNSVSFGGKTYALDGSVASAQVDRVRNEPKAKDAQKVAIGAAAGAIAGKILGKSTKATVIGGAVGAAAGAGAAVATANYEGCIPEGGSIVVKLDNSLTIPRA